MLLLPGFLRYQVLPGVILLSYEVWPYAVFSVSFSSSSSPALTPLWCLSLSISICLSGSRLLSCSSSSSCAVLLVFMCPVVLIHCCLFHAVLYVILFFCILVSYFVPGTYNMLLCFTVDIIAGNVIAGLIVHYCCGLTVGYCCGLAVGYGDPCWRLHWDSNLGWWTYGIPGTGIAEGAFTEFSSFVETASSQNSMKSTSRGSVEPNIDASYF